MASQRDEVLQKLVERDERIKQLEAERDVSCQEVAHLEACERREALLQYLAGFDVALAQASLLCLGANFTGCDPSKEVVGGRLWIWAR